MVGTIMPRSGSLSMFWAKSLRSAVVDNQTISHRIIRTSGNAMITNGVAEKALPVAMTTHDAAAMHAKNSAGKQTIMKGR
jgi:hypothetical protein